MKEEIYRWVKTIAFFYIVFSAVLHILSTPVFNLCGNGEKLLQEFRLNYQ